MNLHNVPNEDLCIAGEPLILLLLILLLLLLLLRLVYMHSVSNENLCMAGELPFLLLSFLFIAKTCVYAQCIKQESVHGK